MNFTFWTLTVDDASGMTTTAHLSEADAIAALFDSYDDDGEFPDHSDLQPLMDARRLTVEITEHTLPLSVRTYAEGAGADWRNFGGNNVYLLTFREGQS